MGKTYFPEKDLRSRGKSVRKKVDGTYHLLFPRLVPVASDFPSHLADDAYTLCQARPHPPYGDRQVHASAPPAKRAHCLCNFPKQKSLPRESFSGRWKECHRGRESTLSLLPELFFRKEAGG